MNLEERNQFLLDVYEHQVVNGNSEAGIQKDLNAIAEYKKKLELIKYWEEKGVVEITVQAMGFTNFKLNSYGIDYVEENLK
ncbi:MAG: hypothetical protein AB2401_08790 [Bacillus sp. (in: firmicutes)]